MVQRHRVTPRGLAPLLISLVLLMQPLWTLPAQETQSGEQEMVPLATCLEELKKLETLSDELLTKQSADFETRLRQAVLEASADTARPLLVEIAGLRAERDYYKRFRWLYTLIGLSAGVAAGAILTGILTTPLPP